MSKMDEAWFPKRAVLVLAIMLATIPATIELDYYLTGGEPAPQSACSAGTDISFASNVIIPEGCYLVTRGNSIENWVFGPFAVDETSQLTGELSSIHGIKMYICSSIQRSPSNQSAPPCVGTVFATGQSDVIWLCCNMTQHSVVILCLSPVVLQRGRYWLVVHTDYPNGVTAGVGKPVTLSASA